MTFDIDAVDPAFAPGTGTPEVGGLTSHEAQQLVRGLAGLSLVGGDIVEVAPPFDGPGPDHGAARGEPDVRVPVRPGAQLGPRRRGSRRRRHRP